MASTTVGKMSISRWSRPCPTFSSSVIARDARTLARAPEAACRRARADPGLQNARAQHRELRQRIHSPVRIETGKQRLQLRDLATLEDLVRNEPRVLEYAVDDT